MSQALPKTGRGSMGRGTLEQVISRATFVLSGYALHISMAYLLKGPSAYGLLGLMISVTNIARVLLSTGLPQATTKFIAEADEELAYPILRTSLKLQWIMAAVITGVYVAGIPLWQNFLNDHTLAPYLLASAPLIPLMGTHQVLLGYFGGLRRFSAQSWLNTLYSVGRVVFAIAFVLLGFGVGGVLWGFSASLAVALVISWNMVKPRNPGPNPESRRLIAFALPLMILAIGQSLVVNLDVLMLKHFLPGGAEVGFYTGAMNLGSAPYYIFSAFSITMLPLVTTALRDGDKARASRLVARNVSFLIVVVSPIIGIVLAAARAPSRLRLSEHLPSRRVRADVADRLPVASRGDGLTHVRHHRQEPPAGRDGCVARLHPGPGGARLRRHTAVRYGRCCGGEPCDDGCRRRDRRGADIPLLRAAV